MNAHRKLLCWQACIALIRVIYQTTRRFPTEERYVLTSQLRRAAVSTASNIAEGHARMGIKEKAQGANVAIGSLAEIDTLLVIAEAEGYLTKREFENLDEKRARASQLTVKWHQSLLGRTAAA
jgi:four helix bundle protein